jgi:hypothetical protein
MDNVENKKRNELYNETMLEIKKTKAQFRMIIDTINHSAELRNLFTPDMHMHLKILIEMWRNNKDADVDFYMKFKEHHIHINNKINNPMFESMWKEYVIGCCRFRSKLLFLENKIKNL